MKRRLASIVALCLAVCAAVYCAQRPFDVPYIYAVAHSKIGLPWIYSPGLGPGMPTPLSVEIFGTLRD